MLRRAASLIHLDFAPQHEQPSAWRVLLATVASVVGSLAADAILVAIGTTVFPSTKGYVHFQLAAPVRRHGRQTAGGRHAVATAGQED